MYILQKGAGFCAFFLYIGYGVGIEHLDIRYGLWRVSFQFLF